MANPSSYYDALARGACLYTVIRLLPEDAGEFQYHIQRTGGGEQRRVRESLLRIGASPQGVR